MAATISSFSGGAVLTSRPVSGSCEDHFTIILSKKLTHHLNFDCACVKSNFDSL